MLYSYATKIYIANIVVLIIHSIFTFKVIWVIKTPNQPRKKLVVFLIKK
jgi:hypothetical protein